MLFCLILTLSLHNPNTIYIYITKYNLQFSFFLFPSLFFFFRIFSSNSIGTFGLVGETGVKLLYKWSMSFLTTDNYSLILILTPLHFLNVFGLFPFLLSQPLVVNLFRDKNIFTRLRISNTCCSTYANGTVALLSIFTGCFQNYRFNFTIM